MANPHRYTYPSSSSAPPASTPPALNWQHMDTSVFPAAHLDTVSSVADAPSADRSLPSVCELFPHWPYPPNQATQIGGGPSPPLPLPPAAPPYGCKPFFSLLFRQINLHPNSSSTYGSTTGGAQCQ
ncbi:hypothetical protein BOTBODRAFT_56714 [Botryobasidium botryosum FD-172 SS1]|uniref:Uncharacterized protein n=1 Tax=Botryobasidium botryosum (strain FD-172 SS1) TaxID=930990 RepID=A0A067MA50_BOTB1|nr:hypothetical protein BOTBODRAFT_56714 [Botryobasidium botryosum FD-172 SS1]